MTEQHTRSRSASEDSSSPSSQNRPAGGDSMHGDPLAEDSFRDPTPFEVGETTLDLDDVSDQELADLYFADDEEESGSFLNLPTVAGLGLILVGIAYLLTSLGVWAGPDLEILFEMLPIVGGVMIILLGFGLLSWRSDSSEKQRATRATRSAEKIEDDVAETVSDESSSKSSKKSSARKKSSNWKKKVDRMFSSVPSISTKRLRRSRTDKKLLGVCGGIANYLNLDPTLVRIAFVVGTIATGGPFVLAYLGLGFAMPKEDALSAEERIRIIKDS